MPEAASYTLPAASSREARLRRIYTFGAECLYDLGLHPLDGWGLAVFAAWPLTLTGFRDVTVGRNHLRDANEAEAERVRMGVLAPHATVRRSAKGRLSIAVDFAALALDLARGGVSACPPFPLRLAICGVAAPEPDTPVDRIARWYPYSKAFDMWMESRFLPSTEAACREADASLQRLREKWVALGDAEVRPLFAAEDVLAPFRGAVKRAAGRRHVDRRLVWAYGREKYASPVDADTPEAAIDEIDRAVAFAVLSRLPPSADGKGYRPFGVYRVGKDGLLRWNYAAAADRLVAEFLKRREVPETNLARRGTDEPRSVTADAEAPEVAVAAESAEVAAAAMAALRARIETLSREALEGVRARHTRAALEYAWRLFSNEITIAEVARRTRCARPNVSTAWKYWRARLRADPVVRRLGGRLGPGG